MAALLENAMSVTVRGKAKRTKIWDHKGYKSQITNIFKNSKFYKKNQNGSLAWKCYLNNGESYSKTDENLGSQGE